MIRAGLKKLTWASIIAIALGFVAVLYGQALAAFLSSECSTFRGPGLSFRCSQPMVYLYVGFGLMALGACGLGAALVLRLRRLPSSK